MRKQKTKGKKFAPTQRRDNKLTKLFQCACQQLLYHNWPYILSPFFYLMWVQPWVKHIKNLMIYFNCLWDGHLWETSPSCQFKKCPSHWKLISWEGVACVQTPPPSPPSVKKIQFFFFCGRGDVCTKAKTGSWQRAYAFGVINLQRHSYCVLAETSRLCLKTR